MTSGGSTAAGGDADLAAFRAAIIAVYPELSDSRFTRMTFGWDALAIDVDDRLIFKFPRSDAGGAGLVREAGLLAVIHPAVTMPVPRMRVHRGERLFTEHDKLPGDQLTSEDYAGLDARERDRLAQDLGLFYAQLHALPVGTMRAAGAGPLRPWLLPDEILRRARPALPDALWPYAKATIAAWQCLPPDPLGQIYGFFDGHGKNMAFDHARGKLNGMFDFGDSGIGDLHQEFVYSNWIDPDLTDRLIIRYEASTGRSIDRSRVELLSGALRLSELCDFEGNTDLVNRMRNEVTRWAGRAATRST